MKSNKNIIIVILLLSVFAVGTLQFVDTVEAATWKKHDSGSWNLKTPFPTYKKKVSFTTYIKGSKDIKMNIYGYKTKNNKKTLLMTFYMSKTGNKVKLYSNILGSKTKPTYSTYSNNIKTYYKKIFKPTVKYTL
ncbi:MAG: hypothetical protein LBU74_05670 [Methanobacteriaceae archaeon]|jgi:hypothetical protein|nr:hypothetical protein [Candidatus Methanorudis spinitermitis]